MIEKKYNCFRKYLKLQLLILLGEDCDNFIYKTSEKKTTVHLDIRTPIQQNTEITCIRFQIILISTIDV